MKKKAIFLVAILVLLAGCSNKKSQDPLLEQLKIISEQISIMEENNAELAEQLKEAREKTQEIKSGKSAPSGESSLPTSTPTPTNSPRPTYTSTPTLSPTKAPSELDIIYSKPDAFTFITKAHEKEDYWQKSEVLAGNTIKIEKGLKKGTAYVSVYFPKDQETDGDYNLEWWIDNRNGSYFAGNDNKVNAVEIRKIGKKVRLRVDYSFNNAAKEARLVVKVHHKGKTTNKVYIYDYLVKEDTGEEYSYEEFSDSYIEVYDLIGTNGKNNVDRDFVFLADGVDFNKDGSNAKTIYKSDPIGSSFVENCEKVRLTIGAATDEGWWDSSETNLFAEMDKPDFLSNGYLKVYFCVPEDSDVDGNYVFEVLINEINFRSIFNEIKDISFDVQKANRYFDIVIPYDERINNYDGLTVMIKSHHKGTTKTDLEIYGYSFYDASGNNVLYDLNDIDLTATEYNHRTKVRRGIDHEIVNEDGDSKSTFFESNKTGLCFSPYKEEVFDNALYEITASLDEDVALKNSNCRITVFAPGNMSIGRGVKCNTDVYGKDDKGEDLLLTSFSIDFDPQKIMDKENTLVFSDEKGYYITINKPLNIEEDLSGDIKVMITLVQTSAEGYITDITFDDYVHGIYSLNIADVGIFRDESENIPSVAFVPDKVGRKIYLEDFENQLFTNSELQVIPASDLYGDVRAVIESLNTDIATVTDSGVIKPIKAGTARIKATEVDSEAVAEYELTIIDPYLEIENARFVVFTDNDKSFGVNPVGFEGGKYKWTSSAPGIISVDQNGNIKGVSAGNATITVCDTITGYKGTIDVKCIDSGGINYSDYITITRHPEISDEIQSRVEELLYTVYVPVYDFYNYGEFRHMSLKYDHILDQGVFGVTSVLIDEPIITMDITALKENHYDVITHELIHTAQNYPFITTSGEDVTWLGEGLTDYGRYMFGIWNDLDGWTLTPYSPGQNYDNSYGVTGNFIKFVVDNYDSQFAVKLNDAFKEEKYSHDLWKVRTGYSIEELWERYASGITK